MDRDCFSQDEIAYLLLQHFYLQKIGLEDVSESEILEKHHDIFPDGWFSYGVARRIKIMQLALKNDISLEQAENRC